MLFELPSWDATARDYHHFLITTNRAERTATTYVYNVRGFWRWCVEHEVDPRLVNRQTVRHWAGERQQQVSHERAHNELAALRHLYKFAIEEGWRDDDPTDNVDIKRGKMLPTKPFSQEEIDRLLGACSDERERLIQLTLLYTGVRISELVGMRAEDIDWRNGYIKILGKGDKERLLAPNPEFMGWLHSYVGMFPSGAVFRNKRGPESLSSNHVRSLIYEIGNRAEVEDVRPHRYRATFGTFYMQQFHDLDSLQGIMGHESVSTTARYTYWTKQERALEQMRRFGAGRTA